MPVEDTYQAKAYPEIYAAGIAAQVPVPWQTAVPIGIPKTGFPTESMAKVAAHNIAAAIKGEPPASHKDFGQMAAVCMMNAGNNGVMILADHMLPPRKAAVMIPGPQVHAMKVGFEKYYLWKAGTATSGCPDPRLCLTWLSAGTRYSPITAWRRCGSGTSRGGGTSAAPRSRRPGRWDLADVLGASCQQVPRLVQVTAESVFAGAGMRAGTAQRAVGGVVQVGQPQRRLAGSVAVAPQAGVRVEPVISEQPVARGPRSTLSRR